MVSAGLDFLICVWDMVNHRQLMALPAVESVWSVHFSPDGKQFVTGGNTSNVRVWNTETGEVVLTMKGHEGSVESVLFSPDGNRIFSCGADNTIKVWNAKTGDNLHTIEGEEGRIFGELACSPDGRRLACANSDFSFSVWNTATREKERTFMGHNGSVWSVVFSNDGKRIASGTGRGQIIVWNVESGEKLLTMSKDSKTINSITFSPDDSRIVASSEELATIWDANNGRNTLTIDENSGAVRQALFSPNGDILATANNDGSIRIHAALKKNSPPHSEFARRFARTKRQIDGNKTKPTQRLGGDGGDNYERISRDGSFLVGVHCHLAFFENVRTISGLDFVFANKKGERTNQFVGKQGDAIYSSFAPEGEYVNGITFAHGNYILAMRLQFNSLASPMTHDNTSGRWLGFPDGYVTTSFDFEQNAIIGLRGTNGDIIDSIEIVSTTD